MIRGSSKCRSPDEVIEHLKKNHILIGPKYPVLDKYIARVARHSERNASVLARLGPDAGTGKMAM